MHGVIRDTTVPLVYSLRSKTSERKVRTIWQHLRIWMLSWSTRSEHRLRNCCHWSPKIKFSECKLKRLLFSFCTSELAKKSKSCIGERIPRKHRLTNCCQVFRSYCTNTGRRHLSWISKLKESASEDAKWKNAGFVSYFEATWLRGKSLQGRRTGASFLQPFLCQFCFEYESILVRVFLNPIVFEKNMQKNIWRDIWFFIAAPPCSVPECILEH